MSDYISEDALIQILNYLSVRNLVRFRCVSKRWRQLIDSPAFVQDHLSVQKPRFFIDYGGRKYLVVDPLPRPLLHTLSKPIRKKVFILFGTLHGVVCFLCDKSSILLWNPVLCKLSNNILLPPGFGSLYGYRDRFGFWIDPLTKEFKVIILQKWPVVKCIVYSSVRGDWSVIFPPGKVENWTGCKAGPPIMIGGVAHWGGCFDAPSSVYEHDYDHHHKEAAILSFDFVQECFGFIEMPYMMSPGSYSTAPCRWQDKLSLICWSDSFPHECMLFMRQEDSWVKLFDFKTFEYIEHAFWAMEDAEDRTKGKRKRETMEEMTRALNGEKEVYVRLLATIETDTDTHELALYGTKTGCKYLRREPVCHLTVSVGYDYVDSLLFP